MKSLLHYLKTGTVMLFALSCGVLSILWPEWAADLKAQGNYPAPSGSGKFPRAGQDTDNTPAEHSQLPDAGQNNNFIQSGPSRHTPSGQEGDLTPADSNQPPPTVLDNTSPLENPNQVPPSGRNGDLPVTALPQVNRFAVNGDCVADNQTGLLWAKYGNLHNNKRTWQGALDFIAALNSGAGLCGFNDWRIPSINDFSGLANSGQALSGGWLNSSGFSDVGSYCSYWSSTAYNDDVNIVWIIEMGGGAKWPAEKTAVFCTWPVRKN
jgi:hypothetical protein